MPNLNDSNKFVKQSMNKSIVNNKTGIVMGITPQLRATIIANLDARIGDDPDNLVNTYIIENDLALKRKQIEMLLDQTKNESTCTVTLLLDRGESDKEKINELLQKQAELQVKIQNFLTKVNPLQNEIGRRIVTISKLEKVVEYLQTYQKVDDLSRQLEISNEDEQSVFLYGELKKMLSDDESVHKTTYIKDTINYWHNILKEKYSKQFDDVLKAIKWPFTSAAEIPQPTKEISLKFKNLTKHLLLIEKPKEVSGVHIGKTQDQETCLPVKFLIVPLKKRFTFHFTGTRQTARIDRPEWFLTQTLTWIKDHSSFIKKNVQPIADSLGFKHIKAEVEFNTGLLQLAAERLHTVLGSYNTIGSKGESLDVEAAFAHAVDETLGFQKELNDFTNEGLNNILSVLTRAETFVKWLAIEKKYALTKMEEVLSADQWMEPVAGGVTAAVGAVVWVPRGADWFVTLLQTIEDRYSVLPQPGHRLQFLELQLELLEEWRVRLTQVQAAAAAELTDSTFLAADNANMPHPLTATINAAYYTKTRLLQWAHSLHYLQLYYYKRQFVQFTQRQHRDESNLINRGNKENPEDTELPQTSRKLSVLEEKDETVSLSDIEEQSNRMAMGDLMRRESATDNAVPDISDLLPDSPTPSSHDVKEGSQSRDLNDESGVFGEVPALLEHLRNTGIATLAQHFLLEFKATLHEYKNQKWHALQLMEKNAYTISPALCRPLAGVSARLHSASNKLAPSLFAKLRVSLASEIDSHLFDEVVMDSYWNSGGVAQLTHDIKRNIAPTLALPNQNPEVLLPKLIDACAILNTDYEDGRRIQVSIIKCLDSVPDMLAEYGVRSIDTGDVLNILNRRTDLGNAPSDRYAMEVF